MVVRSAGPKETRVGDSPASSLPKALGRAFEQHSGAGPDDEGMDERAPRIQEQESCHYPLHAIALKRVGSAPQLGNPVELALMIKALVSQP